ncbi:MAG: phospholipase D family protein [Marinobacter sp.]|nr:phospholipase D family protein [Marinobacter sp.]
MFRLLLLLLSVTVLLAACSTSPTPFTHEVITPVPQPATSGPFLGWQPADDDPDNESPLNGFRLLYDGAEAFSARLQSARLAQQHLNIQYYIWRDDKAGQRLVYELINAAERGVKVSVLLDDMDVRGSDRALAILDQHDNIEVRVFNPFISRWGMLRFGIEFIFRGSDLNHRMHNKAWIADGHFAIVGGRNIGDEYFDASPHFNFSDLDMAIAGPMAHEADAAFTAYWNSPAAVPIRHIKRLDKDRRALEDKRHNLRAWLNEQEHHPLHERFHTLSDEPSPLLNADYYEWSRHATFVADDPGKATHKTPLDPGVLEALIAHFLAVERELLIISPYFVPGEEGTRYLSAMARRGIDIHILTNSLAANDVVFAHSGYAKRRQALAEAGIRLYELKPNALRAAEDAGMKLGLGSSRASLHTKAILFDGRELFVGSFNLDPRSANLNTEQGVFTADPALAAQFARLFRLTTDPAYTYRVSLDDQGRVIWTDGLLDVYHRDPGASLWRRFLSGFAGMLPIEAHL